MDFSITFKKYIFNLSNIPGLVAQKVKNLSAMQEIWVQSLGQEDSLEKEMSTYSNILASKIPMDRRAWLATVHGVTETDTNKRLTFNKVIKVTGNKENNSI